MKNWALLSVAGLCATGAFGAEIQFDTPRAVVSEKDFETAGTPQYAVNLAEGDDVAFGGLNGVAFTAGFQERVNAYNLHHDFYRGDALPGGLENVFDNGVHYAGGNRTIELTLDGLKPGQKYLVQLFAADDRPGSTLGMAAGDGGGKPTRTWSAASGATALTGRFMADHQRQVISLTPIKGSSAMLAAYQLRDISASPDGPFAADERGNPNRVSTGTPYERDWSGFPIMEGKFDRSVESLQHYECPEWFRDAKFGIWAICGPQAVPQAGDWYARNMYIQGSRQYQIHLEKYGHPSEFGYKDIIALFNPKDLNYDRLLGLYKRAGAKYAAILAVHHDNFDLWDSKHHSWNSVNKGPRRDLVGEFSTAARKHGLRLGITTHHERCLSWLQTAKESDLTGPKAGVPYDGANPEYEELYLKPYANSPHPPSNPPEWFEQDWYLRTKDLIDSYQPDLMYVDGSPPFRRREDNGAIGRHAMAHFYNASMAWNNGNLKAVYNFKGGPAGTYVHDVERGRIEGMADEPWQTDTCIGGWYYKKSYYDTDSYKTVEQVTEMLIDIVSKNGNLLLNIPIHPDGWIDAKEEALLKGMGEWMFVNGEGIYETRPWIRFGEGPSLTGDGGGAGSFGGHKDVRTEAYSPKDLRFTAKGDQQVFAFFMTWPETGTLTVTSMPEAKGNGTIKSVKLLGVDAPVSFAHTVEGLQVELPEEVVGKHAWALKIEGNSLRRFPTDKTLAE